MKTFISLLSLFLFTIGLSAQSLTGSWRIDKVENLNPDPPVVGDLNYEGQIFHFPGEELFVMETDSGYYSSSYLLDDRSIQLFDFNLAYELIDTENLRITYDDTLSNRLIAFNLKPSNGLDKKVLEQLRTAHSTKSLTDFRLDGVYYRYDEVWKQYRYIRFFPDSSRLITNIKEGPEVAAPFLSQAYTRSAKLESINPAAADQNAAAIFLSSYKRGREETAPRVYSESTYTAEGENLKVREYSYNSDKETLNDETHSYQFHPTERLAFWTLKDKQIKLKTSPYTHLLLPTSQKFNGAFKVVEEMPRFPGCEEETDEKVRQECSTMAMLKYIYGNIRYPNLARENGNEGMVVITFIVEKNGTISNARIARDVKGGCGKEALRVINKMNTDGLRWTPGKQDGKAVRVQFNMPVKFKLEGRTPKKKKKRSRG